MTGLALALQADVLNVDPESRARGAKGKAAAAIAAAAVSDSEDSDGETKEGSVHDRVARSLYKEGGVVRLGRVPEEVQAKQPPRPRLER